MADRVKQFRAFVHIAKAKNFTRASEALGLTQPTLSALMSQFESELGIKLLDRTTRTVVLTEAGELLLPNAERILQDVDNTVGALFDTAALFRGRVQFVAMPSLCLRIVPKGIKEFGNDYPGVQVSLLEEPSGPLIDLVQSGRCEFGIGVVPSDRIGLRFHKIASDELSLVCETNHPLAQSDTVAWNDIKDHSVIAMADATSVRSLIEQASSVYGFTLNYVIEVKNMATAIGFAKEGVGAAIIPTAASSAFVDEGLKSVRLVQPTLTRDIGLIQKADRLLSPAASELASRFVSLISKSPQFL